MSTSTAKVLPCRHRVLSIPFTLLLVAFSVAPSTSGQSARNQVEGVLNFGQVTEGFFRGGAVTPAGVEALASMGVKTIIDLRDKPSPGEPEACKQNGVKYYKFPMDGSVTPDDKAVHEILSIIQNSKEPVYVHCSAGKHRAGTIAALYRMQVQGWSKEKAWDEQQSYGFGPAEEHPALYAYAYGANSNKNDASAVQTNFVSAAKSKSSKSRKSEDGEKDKSLKKDDDDDDDDDDAKVKDESDKKSKKKAKTRSESFEVGVKSAANAKAEATPVTETKPNVAVKSLSATTSYITMADAIERAQAEGGSGELLKVDLEWDEVRSTVTWDVTFSSGNEYEIDAVSGKFLGAKAKTPAKLAVLMPLLLNERGLLSFQEIIRKAETARGQSVMEMELKRIKGRAATMFEVILAEGTALFYDAVTGRAVTDM